MWTGCWKAGSCRQESHPGQFWKARPHCIWDLFICCEAFLWRDNAKRMSINCRAKARVSWPSSSVQALAPSQQLSHEPSLQIIFPALHPQAARSRGWLASAWPWGSCRGCAMRGGLAVQEELAFPLNRAGGTHLPLKSLSWFQEHLRGADCVSPTWLLAGHRGPAVSYSFCPGAGSETR